MSHDEIVDNIYNIITKGKLISIYKTQQKRLVEWLDNELIENIDKNERNNEFFHDLLYYSCNFEYENYIKTVISYSILSPVLGLSFSPDGKYLLSGDASGKIIKYDVEYKTTETLKGQKDSVREIIFIDNNRFVSSSCDNSVLLWNINKCSIERLICNHKDFAYSVAYDPVNNSIASVGSDRALRINNLSTNDEIIIDVKKSLRDVEFSKDGKFIAVCGKSGIVHLCKDNKLCFSWEAHDICVRDSIFIKNDLLVTSGDDAQIKVWKIDYKKLTVECIQSMVDKDLEYYTITKKNYKGMAIYGCTGFPNDRRGWLYRHCAIRIKKKSDMEKFVSESEEE